MHRGEPGDSAHVGKISSAGGAADSRAAGLGWADVEGLTDEALETRLDSPGPTGKGRCAWKTVERVLEGAVLWGLAHRRWRPLHVIGIDEVSRRQGHPNGWIRSIGPVTDGNSNLRTPVDAERGGVV